MTEPITETQQIEQRITEALVTIRREWPHMMPRSAPGKRLGGGGQSAGVVGDNGPAKINGSGQPYWESDHSEGGHDIDGTTRLVSLRRSVKDSLNGWSRVVMEDRPVTKALPDGLSVDSMARFLERHAQWVSGHEAAEDMADEVGGLARRVDRLVSPKPKVWASLGTCPLEVEQDGRMVTCGGTVRYREDYRDEAGEAMPECSACGVSAVGSWWEDRMFDDPELRKFLTYADVATLAHHMLGKPVAHRTVKMWASRGIIKPSGEVDDVGRVLFARDATVYALDQWKRVTSV